MSPTTETNSVVGDLCCCISNALLFVTGEATTSQPMHCIDLRCQCQLLVSSFYLSVHILSFLSLSFKCFFYAALCFSLPLPLPLPHPLPLFFSFHLPLCLSVCPAIKRVSYSIKLNPDISYSTYRTPSQRETDWMMDRWTDGLWRTMKEIIDGRTLECR